MRLPPPITLRVALTLFALGATSACARLDELWNANTGRPPPLDDDVLAVRIDLGDDDASITEPAPTPSPSDASVSSNVVANVVPDDANVVPDDANTIPDDANTIPDDANAIPDDANTIPDDASAASAVLDTRPTITALTFRAGIVESPNSGARWVGYIRVGGRVAVVRGPLGNDGCPARRDVPGAGWYQVEGGGYVCVGYLATLTSSLDRTPRRFPVQPDLDAAMPLPYGIVSRAGAMYRRPPTDSDERTIEPERFAPRVSPNSTAATTAPDAASDDSAVGASVTADATTVGTVATGASVTADATTVGTVATDASVAAINDGAIRIEELEGAAGTPLLRRVLPRMYVSLDRTLRAPSGNTYWHTQGGGYLREGTISTLRSAPTFQGVHLDATTRLPVAFAISNVTPIYRREGSSMIPTGRAPRLQFFQLVGDEPVRIGAETYHHTTDGTFVRSRNVRVVSAQSPPPNLAPNEKWIDVNLDHQSVVAYEGATPVYATVASTGLRRRSATANYETIQGAFRIQSKHVATTMDGNSDNGPYSIEDVPWVMYYEQSFALHGAFWHNSFGAMRSHGCVNLSPPDARFFFLWSEPRIPTGWHGAYGTARTPGTWVFVHYDSQALGERGGPANIPTH